MLSLQPVDYVLPFGPRPWLGVGAPANEQMLLTAPRAMSETRIILTKHEQLCLTWACNGLSYELIDEKHFRRTFGLVIPQSVQKSFGCILRHAISLLPRCHLFLFAGTLLAWKELCSYSFSLQRCQVRMVNQLTKKFAVNHG